MVACVFLPDPPDDAAALLGALADGFGPEWELRGPSVLFSVAGLRRLFGDPHAIAQRIAAQAAEQGLVCSVALAPAPESAALLAAQRSGITVVLPGQERAALADLPLASLPLSAPTQEALARWGLRNLGEVLRLPASDLVARLGPHAAELHKLATGSPLRPLQSAPPAHEFVRALMLEHAESTLEPLLFLLSGMLVDLCRELTEHGHSTDRVELNATAESGRALERLVLVSFPTRDNRLLARCLQSKLEADPLPEGAVALRLRCVPVPPRSWQGGLFDAAAPEPAQLELALARLRTLVGEENVGRAVLPDSHEPHATLVQPFVAQRVNSTGAAGALVLALRLLRPRVPAQVRCERGFPVAVRSTLLSGPVAACNGPWRTSGRWWTDGQWDTDHWDVLLQGTLCRLAMDRVTRVWALEGLYD